MSDEKVVGSGGSTRAKSAKPNVKQKATPLPSSDLKTGKDSTPSKQDALPETTDGNPDSKTQADKPVKPDARLKKAGSRSPKESAEKPALSAPEKSAPEKSVPEKSVAEKPALEKPRPVQLPMPKPLIDQAVLSIVIPVAKPTRQLDRLLRELNDAIISAKAAQLVEVVLCPMTETWGSLDGHLELCNVARAIEPEAFLPTIDTMLLSILPALRGMYVWMLEIDDALLPHAFNKILPVLDLENPRVLLLNPTLRLPGEPMESLLLPEAEVAGLSVKTTFSTYLFRLGFTGPLAAHGAVIFPHARVASIDWKKFAAHSSVYTHLAVIAAACWRTPATVMLKSVHVKVRGENPLKNPLFAHALATSMNVSFSYFDVTGLIALVAEVEDQTRVRNIFGRTQEYRVGNSRRLSAMILELICGQLENDITQIRVAGSIGVPELERFCNYASLFDATMVQMAETLERVGKVVIPLIRSLSLDVVSKPKVPVRLTQELEMLPEDARNAIWAEISSWALSEIGQVLYGGMVSEYSSFSTVEAMETGTSHISQFVANELGDEAAGYEG